MDTSPSSTRCATSRCFNEAEARAPRMQDSCVEATEVFLLALRPRRARLGWNLDMTADKFTPTLQ